MRALRKPYPRPSPGPHFREPLITELRQAVVFGLSQIPAGSAPAPGSCP